MNNANINGSGSIGGGVYNTVTINGSGKVNGDLVCQNMTINGSGCVNGNLQAKGSFTINGSGRVDGSVTESGTVSINGSGKINGSVRCQFFRSSGASSVDGDCEGEDVEINGGGHIGGLLNGERVRILLHGNSRVTAGSIGGADIRVQWKLNGSGMNVQVGKGVENVLKFFGVHLNITESGTVAGQLETDTIEGDTIELEYTTAGRVSGRVVKIGPGCRIGRVEYTESAEIDSENSTVEESVQIR